MENNNDKPLGVAQAASYLGLAVDSLYYLTSKKLIPHYKPTGGKLYFRLSELEAWVYQSRIATCEELEAIALKLPRRK